MTVDSINMNNTNKIRAAENSATQSVMYKTEPYQNDSVEISGKEKKKASVINQTFITTSSILGGIVLAGMFIMNRKAGKLTKLYNEKMVFTELPEKLKFKEAKTVEEGIKFAKEVLKIGEVDKDFSLEAINFANRGLIDVANANKGKLFMPKHLRYGEFENEIAHVNKDINSSRFGELGINKQYFDDEFLTSKLKDNFISRSEAKKSIQKNNKNGAKSNSNDEIIFAYCYEDKIIDLIKRFTKNPKNLNITEKRELYFNAVGACNLADTLLSGAPLTALKNNKKLWEKFGINVDYEAFAKLTNEEQSKKIREYFLEAKRKKGDFLDLNIPLYSPLKTIYHEMGHLQDFAANLKRLDVKRWKVPSFKDFYYDAKNNTNHTGARIKHVDNRWGGLTYKGYEDLFKKNPKVFQERYPDLYEFLTNQESQQTAGKVSWYAQTSIGEFIADTYAKMISGEVIPEDVKRLYEKYNGPKLPQ